MYSISWRWVNLSRQHTVSSFDCLKLHVNYRDFYLDYWSGQDFMLEWITAVAAMQSPPHVLSISYGADEDYITESYANSFNIVAMQLGVMGVTIVASSGDDGAISQSARSNPLGCRYAASFPASSPYVTAVGGTMVRTV